MEYIKCDENTSKHIEYRKIAIFTNTKIIYENNLFIISVIKEKHNKNIQKAKNILLKAIIKYKNKINVSDIQSLFYHEKYKLDSRPISQIKIPKKNKTKYDNKKILDCNGEYYNINI